MAHGLVEENAKVLDHDKKIKLNFAFTNKDISLACAIQPKRSSAEERKVVTSPAHNSVPLAQKFFEQVGVDLLVTVWKFLHRGDLCEFLSLMLTSKGIYSRLKKDKELLFQIAKESFTLFYLTDLERFCERIHSFAALLQYAAPTHGAELGYLQWNGASSQFLSNRKLLKQPLFSISLIVKPIKCSKTFVVVKCKKNSATRLMNLLQEFEAAHNAIALKIYKPRKEHYPLTMHNLTARIMPPVLPPEENKVFQVVCRLNFSVQLNSRYSFALWGTHWKPLPSSTASQHAPCSTFRSGTAVASS